MLTHCQDSMLALVALRAYHRLDMIGLGQMFWWSRSPCPQLHCFAFQWADAWKGSHGHFWYQAAETETSPAVSPPLQAMPILMMVRATWAVRLRS